MPTKNLLLLGKKGFVIITGIPLSNKFKKIIVEWVLIQFVIVFLILQRTLPKNLFSLGKEEFIIITRIPLLYNFS